MLGFSCWINAAACGERPITVDAVLPIVWLFQNNWLHVEGTKVRPAVIDSTGGQRRNTQKAANTIDTTGAVLEGGESEATVAARFSLDAWRRSDTLDRVFNLIG